MSARGGDAWRWVLSFADLCLLLVCVFALLQAQRGQGSAVAAGLRGAFDARARDMRRLDEPAAPLFEAGEAVLRPAARARFAALGRQSAARRSAVAVESSGFERGSHRFDGWELSAARVAAIARALADGGLDPARISVAVPPSGSGKALRSQHILVTVQPAS